MANFTRPTKDVPFTPDNQSLVQPVVKDPRSGLETFIVSQSTGINAQLEGFFERRSAKRIGDEVRAEKDSLEGPFQPLLTDEKDFPQPKEEPVGNTGLFKQKRDSEGNIVLDDGSVLDETQRGKFHIENLIEQQARVGAAEIRRRQIFNRAVRKAPWLAPALKRDLGLQSVTADSFNIGGPIDQDQGDAVIPGTGITASSLGMTNADLDTISKQIKSQEDAAGIVGLGTLADRFADPRLQQFLEAKRLAQINKFMATQTSRDEKANQEDFNRNAANHYRDAVGELNKAQKASQEAGEPLDKTIARLKQVKEELLQEIRVAQPSSDQFNAMRTSLDNYIQSLEDAAVGKLNATQIQNQRANLEANALIALSGGDPRNLAYLRLGEVAARFADKSYGITLFSQVAPFLQNIPGNIQNFGALQALSTNGKLGAGLQSVLDALSEPTDQKQRRVEGVLDAMARLPSSEVTGQVRDALEDVLASSIPATPEQAALLSPKAFNDLMSIMKNPQYRDVLQSISSRSDTNSFLNSLVSTTLRRVSTEIDSRGVLVEPTGAAGVPAFGDRVVKLVLRENGFRLETDFAEHAPAVAELNAKFGSVLTALPVVSAHLRGSTEYREEASAMIGALASKFSDLKFEIVPPPAPEPEEDESQKEAERTILGDDDLLVDDEGKVFRPDGTPVESAEDLVKNPNQPVEPASPGTREELNVEFKKGVKLDGVQPEASAGMTVADGVFKAAGVSMVVTSVTDDAPGRKANSKHKTGQAFDLRTRNIPADKRDFVVTELKRRLGDNYDVVDEGDHVHVEFDP